MFILYLFNSRSTREKLFRFLPLHNVLQAIFVDLVEIVHSGHLSPTGGCYLLFHVSLGGLINLYANVDQYSQKLVSTIVEFYSSTIHFLNVWKDLICIMNSSRTPFGGLCDVLWNEKSWNININTVHSDWTRSWRKVWKVLIR